jgi:small subunit ribosomal protein S9
VTVAEAKKDKKTYHFGTGRRKTAVARVRLCDGTGQIEINGRELNAYFTEEKDRRAVLGPLELVEMRNKLDLFVNVQGGGFTGQGGAISQGVARALKEMFGGTEPAPAAAEGAEGEGGGSISKKIRDSGYLTRDGRMKERKKYGLKAARKAFQFSKR